MGVMVDKTIEELTIDTIRTLTMDAVQRANSGHPGTAMALAPLAYVLWKRILKYNPKNPLWLNRDRFVLSNGHASLLQYAPLYLTGYDINLDDIKNFRQWGSITPGHPEYDLTPGIETTTGPLGQGIMTAVGMAIAEAHLSAVYNKDQFNIFDHYTYVFASDGDMMEGASHEAASVAGHLGLHKLIVVYDDNHISIEGKTEITFTDDVAKRFDGYHWHVQNLGEAANDLDRITNAIKQAQEETSKPSLIILRSHIAYGAPNKQDTPEAHGSPLGEDEVAATKKFYHWPQNENFLIPDNVLEHMREQVNVGQQLEKEWQKKYSEYKKTYPDLAKQLEESLQQKLPSGWDENIPEFKPSDGPLATRKISAKVINSIADRLPWLVGGSGDLAPSTNTLIKDSDYFEKGNYKGRNIAWGVREHVMCAASSGIALHGGLRPYAATFFIFTDYARPAIRLASLMELPVIYVMTHDSIGLGEDGPTHQPVEHLASFRAMPHMQLIRPADANEATYAWRAALNRTDGPTILVLTRQSLPVFDRSQYAPAEGVLKGAYILSKEKGEKPDLLLMASGSEVQLILQAQQNLNEKGIDARVISFPSWDLFRKQPQEYRDQVIPPSVQARVSVEAAHPLGWCEWVGEKGVSIGVERFGASAPYKENFKHYGFTVENIIDVCQRF
ncbi:MAG: transketolase [Chlamydiales bacterium]